MSTEPDKLPMNIGLLTLTNQNLQGVKEVTVLDSMEGTSKTFHPQGLYSVDIFGKVGDERRNRQYGYIDLGIPILHPLIYKNIARLKELYARVLAGKAYATFDNKTKDIVPSNIKEGRSGYSFFLEHLENIKFEQRPSDSRFFTIASVEKAKKEGALYMDKLLVMPAGLRDYIITPNGKPEEDDINTLYRRIISIASIIKSQAKVKDMSHLDATRFSLQSAVGEIYDYILNLLEGKNKLVQGHWASRSVHYSSRNVMTATAPKSNKLYDELSQDSGSIIVGLYQGMMSAFPLAGFHIRNYASRVFIDQSGQVAVVDKKTLKKVYTTLSHKFYDEWMSQDGLEFTMGKYEQEALRHDQIEVGDYYFGLLYDDGTHVKFLQGIEDLPDDRNPKHVKPITYTELFYIATFEALHNLPAYATRYPVIEMGSTYPGKTYVKTTTKSNIRKLLSDDWHTVEHTLPEFPIRGGDHYNSMSVHVNHTHSLGLDRRRFEVLKCTPYVNRMIHINQ